MKLSDTGTQRTVYKSSSMDRTNEERTNSRIDYENERRICKR